jgi:hypothetical protein
MAIMDPRLLQRRSAGKLASRLMSGLACYAIPAPDLRGCSRISNLSRE